MKKVRIFFTILFSFVALIASAHSTNEENYRKAESEFAKRHYTQARNLCKKIRDTGDSNYSTKCQALIARIDKMEKEEKILNDIPRKQNANYISVPSIICLPYGVTSQDVTVKASGSWDAYSNDAWISTKTSKRYLTITAVEQNTSTKKKKSKVTVVCGEQTKLITVEQDGAPELLEYKSKYLKVPYNGGQFIVDLNTNTNWQVDYADWYKAIPLNGDSTRMVITIDKNTKNEDRNGTIIVRSESGDSYDQMDVYQYANESNIFTAVDSIVQVGVQGDSLMIPVVSDNPSWTPSDCPSWCREVKMSKDTLQLIIVPNENFLSREGFANIKSNDRVSGIWIKQDARELSEFKESKILGGRNISLGISAGYEIPFVGSSSSGPYNGSVINYSLGNSTENVSYHSSMGFHVGAFADMRLYKNIYIKAGLDYRYVSYNHNFLGDVTRYYNQQMNTVYVGEFQNSFMEDYKFHFLEVPILASNRFVLKDKHNLQLNLGPVVSFAVSGKMKYSGNSDSESVYQHSIIYNKVGAVIGNASGEHMKYTGSMDLFSNNVNGTSTTSTGIIVDRETSFTTAANPFNRVNLGLRAGLTYEYSGIQFDLSYTFMVTNMANSKFWESDRYPIFNQTSDVLMSGYKHRISGLQLSIGYVFRYKNGK